MRRFIVAALAIAALLAIATPDVTHAEIDPALSKAIGTIGALGEAGKQAGRTGQAAHNSTQFLRDTQRMKVPCGSFKWC